MPSPMIRVPEALKEVIQKLAEIHRQGDKRREVEAGLQQLLGDLLADGAVVENLDPDDTLDSTTDGSSDDTIDSSDDDKIDSTSVVRPVKINVDELVSRLRVLEEKMASIEASPLSSPRESSVQDPSSDPSST